MTKNFLTGKSITQDFINSITVEGSSSMVINLADWPNDGFNDIRVVAKGESEIRNSYKTLINDQIFDGSLSDIPLDDLIVISNETPAKSKTLFNKILKDNIFLNDFDTAFVISKN